jgi:sigma-B regulation protein RsbU (phosphoserine phosphatase)
MEVNPYCARIEKLSMTTIVGRDKRMSVGIFGLGSDAQRALLANLRHELRTPINAIIGYSEILLEDLEEQQGCQQFAVDLKNIQESGTQLLSLVNAILDPKKLEASQFDLEIATFGETIRMELRTPLNAVIGYCELLMEDKAATALAADLKKIHTAAQRLVATINDIVTLSQRLLRVVDSDSEEPLDLNLESASASNMLQEVASTIRSLEEERKHEAVVRQGAILVVDDNETNRDLLSRQLERQGYTVAVAANGQQALQMVDVGQYDLILLDVIMPQMNGFQVLVRLKTDERWRHIPVIMISALEEQDSVVSCIEIGAEDYLPKPFNPVLLKARIDASLEKKQLRDREVEYLRQVEAYSQALNQELEKGREIQRNFLPSQLLQVPGWEIAAFFKPARQVAGDFYDAFELPGKCLGFVIADVCDKGVGAALFMALFRSLIRLFSGQTSLYELLPRSNEHDRNPIDSTRNTQGPGFDHTQALQAVRLTNDYIVKNHGDLGMFATLFFGVLDPNTGLLTYINGGHEPLFILNPSGGVRERLKSVGPAVGILPNMDYPITRIQLEPGDIMLGFTDGVPEARTSSGEFFTKERLLSILEQPLLSAAVLLDQISTSVLRHTGEADQYDDITMLAVRRSS